MNKDTIEIGNRNNELTKRAKQLLALNVSRDGILIQLAYLNYGSCEALLPEEELITIVNNLGGL